MFLTATEIIVHQSVRHPHGKGLGFLPFEQEGEHHQLLKPAGHGVFGIGLLDAAADSALPEPEKDQQQNDDQDHVEGEQEGMIEGQHNQTDEGTQKHIDRIQ